MNLSSQLAKQIREVYFGGNWSDSNLKNNLSDVTRQQAILKVDSFNTIADLVYHINYFIIAVIKVLQGGTLDANDKFSFDRPPINSDNDWNNFLDKTYSSAETLADLVENLPESIFEEIFSEEKYGSYYRNIMGIIEHTHYHLGQIVLIKKLVRKV